MGQNNIFRCCETIDETQKILGELHEGFGGGHFIVDTIAKKIIDVGYWWPKLVRDVFEFYRSCDACQKTRGLATQSLAKLVATLPKEPFMKWD
jgi:hypothetical protein